MRIAFFGTSEFAVPALKLLAPYVQVVVTQPDRPSGRGMKLQPSPIKIIALELGLRVETPQKSRTPDYVATIRDRKLDALVVAAYGQILSESLLQSATRGGINLHGSVLPFYRGAAPIQRAILNGESETGVTLMQMDKGMDTGDIIAVERTSIGMKENYGELQSRLADIAASMIDSWLPKIVAGQYSRKPQSHDVATYAPKIERSETWLDLFGNARQEFNRVRAFTPNPGARLESSIGALKIIRADSVDASRPQPGIILSTKPLIVGCEVGALEFIEVQSSGGRKMSGIEFANGARWTVGTSILLKSV